jgi:hypothetical protein
MPETKPDFEKPCGFGAWAEEYYAWQAELIDELRDAGLMDADGPPEDDEDE